MMAALQSREEGTQDDSQAKDLGTSARRGLRDERGRGLSRIGGGRPVHSGNRDETDSDRVAGGAKNNKFKIAGQTVECETATFAGSWEGLALKQVTGIVPTYGGCSLAGVPVTIAMNGCKYGLYNTTDGAGDALVKIEGCEAGKHMTITTTGIKCDITVNPANEAIAEGVRYTNIGATTTRELTIDLTAKPKIVVDTWPEKAVDPICAQIEPATTGRLTGQITLKATSGGAHKGIFVS